MKLLGKSDVTAGLETNARSVQHLPAVLGVCVLYRKKREQQQTGEEETAQAPPLAWSSAFGFLSRVPPPPPRISDAAFLFVCLFSLFFFFGLTTVTITFFYVHHALSVNTILNACETGHSVGMLSYLTVPDGWAFRPFGVCRPGVVCI